MNASEEKGENPAYIPRLQNLAAPRLRTVLCGEEIVCESTHTRTVVISLGGIYTRESAYKVCRWKVATAPAD